MSQPGRPHRLGPPGSSAPISGSIPVSPWGLQNRSSTPPPLPPSHTNHSENRSKHRSANPHARQVARTVPVRTAHTHAGTFPSRTTDSGEPSGGPEPEHTFAHSLPTVPSPQSRKVH